MLSLVLLQLECRRLACAPLLSSMVLRAAASKDGKKCCRRRRYAQLTPLYGLVRRILLMLVAAAAFIARERFVVGGLARYPRRSPLASKVGYVDAPVPPVPDAPAVAAAAAPPPPLADAEAPPLPVKDIPVPAPPLQSEVCFTLPMAHIQIRTSCPCLPPAGRLRFS